MLSRQRLILARWKVDVCKAKGWCMQGERLMLARHYRSFCMRRLSYTNITQCFDISVDYLFSLWIKLNYMRTMVKHSYCLKLDITGICVFVWLITKVDVCETHAVILKTQNGYISIWYVQMVDVCKTSSERYFSNVLWRLMSARQPRGNLSIIN